LSGVVVVVVVVVQLWLLNSSIILFSVHSFDTTTLQAWRYFDEVTKEERSPLH
jgi:hypothetical protein